MQLKFTKMHGLGNDFVMLDLISQHRSLGADHVRRLADRRRGVGCDQVLAVEAPRSPDVDFGYRIFNADGGEVEQCGNGARCLALFVRDRKLTSKREIRVQTGGGVLELRVLEDERVRVDMGVPALRPRDIPFRAEARAADYPLRLAGRELRIGAVSVGNPHAVTIVENVEDAPVRELGPQIEKHPDFPRRTNAGFMQVDSREELRLRVFERGVGETQGCGSGACAAVVVGRIQGLLDEEVRVRLPGGELEISWAGEGRAVMMTGPATRVFEGTVRL